MRNGIELRAPFLVDLRDQDGDGVFVASDSFSSVYGAGDSPEAALEEYLNNLFDQFDALDRDEGSLGAALRRELVALREYLRRVD